MQRKPRVDWTELEQEKVLELMTTMAMNNPGTSLIELMNRLQTNLPENRRRKFTSLSDPTMIWVKEELKKIWEKMREAYRKQQKVEPPPPPVYIPTPQEILDGMSMPELTTYHATRQAEFLDELTATNRINQDLLHKILSRISSPKIEIAKESLPHFCIVGLISDQPEIIRKKFQGRVKLSFVESQVSATKVPQAEKYIVMSKFTRHKWTYLVEDRSKLELVAGGLSDLTAKIEALLA